MCQERTRCFATGMAEAEDKGSMLAEVARGMTGWPFRPQGRGEDGLDCLGLVLGAYGSVGIRFEVPLLAMVGHDRRKVFGWMRQSGLFEISLGRSLPGDILLSFPATRQAHLGIRVASGFVEANARLRRVIERPWADGAGWHSAWRLCWEQG